MAEKQNQKLLLPVPALESLVATWGKATLILFGGLGPAVLPYGRTFSNKLWCIGMIFKNSLFKLLPNIQMVIVKKTKCIGMTDFFSIPHLPPLWGQEVNHVTGACGE